MLDVGSIAPDFSVPLSSVGKFRLSDCRGKKHVVLYFYPKDFTTVCTRQACLFSDHSDEIESLDAILLGISADSSERHREFIKALNLNFPLGTDTDNSVARMYNVFRLGFRRLRVTYVIDKAGIIAGALHHELFIDNHWKSVIAVLRNLGKPHENHH